MSAGKEASPKEPDILKVRAELLQALKGPHDESELVCAVESGANFYNENPDDTEVGEALDWAQKRTAGRWPPKRCEMRDLSYLTSTLTTSYAVNRVFGNAGLQTEPKGHAFFLNVIRLLDKTLREYGEARQYLQSYVDSQNKTSLLFQATDHMENCIGTLHRAFNHLTKLRDHLYKLRESSGMPIPEIGWKAVPKNRATERDSIRHIRDTIKHMHEWILRDDAGSGKAPIGLVVMSDSIELGNTVIYYEDLATWIERAYEVARPLVSYVQPTS